MMNIIVCLKQVPEIAEVKINPETNTLIREGVESIINPFDLYAIEEAIRIKEREEAVHVTALSMGPPQADRALREAIALGCDRAILISGKAFAGSDTWATSNTLARAIEKIGNYELIICGKQAMDGDTAQVGPGIACHLDIPQITFVRKIEKLDRSSIRAERMTEEGYEVIESPLPVLITVVKEINEPRLPSLKGKLQAKKAEVIVWNEEELKLDRDSIGLEGSPTQVIKIFTPPPKKGGLILEGDVSETVEKLAELLKDEVL